MHLRYSHLNERSLQDLSTKGMVYGLPKVKKWSVCEGCEQGKKAREFFPYHGSKTRELLNLVHADVCGPMPVKSLGGNTMFLLFTDEYSRMTWVYFLKEKSEVFANFKLFKVKVELETKTKSVVISRDVTFDELAKWGSKGEGRHELPDEFIMTMGSTSKSCPNNDEASNDPDKDTFEPHTPQTPASHQPQTPHTSTSHHDHASPFATPGSKTPKVRSLADVYECTVPMEDYQTCQLALSSMEPTSFDEAIEHKEWIEVMKVERQALEKHQTWSLTELPEGKKAIGLK
ncbi:uncharacterized protein LOC143594461 [Bidens hawaiensis]|uniref:uncharacterized protein LOC143594461 n=1 Tax=Bidens hawaiensis TaxID=980011 RepID=UPI00404A507A